MANPTNQTNTTIPIETYNILKEIKEKKGCTFDELLDQLCELEFQYNYVQQEQDFELYCRDEHNYLDKIFYFKIVFKKNNMDFIYKTPTGKKSKKISEWGLPDNVRKEFFTFIKEPCARCIFENLPLGLVFEEFDVYKSKNNARR